jgi:hypothetical protein
MKKKNVAGLIGMLVVQSAFATSRCPAEVKAEECGPNPFYVLVVGFSQVCSEKFRERSSDYRVALEKMVAENPKAYAKVDADAKFQKKLSELKQEANKLPMLELEHECRTLLLEVQESEKSSALK